MKQGRLGMWYVKREVVRAREVNCKNICLEMKLIKQDGWSQLAIVEEHQGPERPEAPGCPIGGLVGKGCCGTASPAYMGYGKPCGMVFMGH
jgi:hypothetical protein